MNNHKYFIFRLFFLILSILSLQIGLLANIIDSTFNAQLQITTFLSKSVKHLIVLPDGKILAQGNFNNYNGQTVGALIRLNADGSLDREFKNNLLTPEADLFSVAVRADGKIQR